jgi:hypothetical protein
MHTKFWLEILKRSFCDIGARVRVIILNRILEKAGVRVWIGFIWLSIGTDMWILWTLRWTFGILKRWGISWVAYWPKKGSCPQGLVGRLPKYVLTNTDTRTTAERQVGALRDGVPVLVTESLRVKAVRVRKVFGVTVNTIYRDEYVVSSTEFQWRICRYGVRTVAASVHCRGYWIQPQGLCGTKSDGCKCLLRSWYRV